MVSATVCSFPLTHPLVRHVNDFILLLQVCNWSQGVTGQATDPTVAIGFKDMIENCHLFPQPF